MANDYTKANKGDMNELPPEFKTGMENDLPASMQQDQAILNTDPNQKAPLPFGVPKKPFPPIVRKEITRGGKAPDGEIAWMQAHVDMIRDEAARLGGQAQSLMANGETLSELKRDAQAIESDPAKMQAARDNFNDNKALIQKLQGKGV